MKKMILLAGFAFAFNAFAADPAPAGEAKPAEKSAKKGDKKEKKAEKAADDKAAAPAAK